MPINQKKILIAEDDKDYSKILDFYISKNFSYDIKIAEDGEKVIEFLKNEKFDLILLDLIMSKVDGFQILDYIKENNVKVKVIILSNLSQEEDKKTAIEKGASEYLVKVDTPIFKLAERIKFFLEE